MLKDVEIDKTLEEEIEILMELNNIKCSIKEFCENEEIRKSIKPIDWHWSFYSYKDFSEGFIRLFSDELDWRSVCENQTLSEPFIREFRKQVHWNSIIIHQDISENFLREMKDEEDINWSLVSKHIILSDTFIEDFSDKLNWYVISSYQNLSDYIMIKFRDKLYWNKVVEGHSFSNFTYEKLSDYIDWGYAHDSSNTLLLKEYVLNQIREKEYLKKLIKNFKKFSYLTSSDISEKEKSKIQKICEEE
jgi:hypothetical protein